MRIGIQTPVVTRVPGHACEWEAGVGAEELVEVAVVADELGFDHLTCSEHVAVPVEDAARRGQTYWDPLATLSFLAACTRRIRLVTSVLVLPYHHPIALAKRYGTLDRLSDGRLVLGVGVGSLREEFDLLGVRWDSRGDDADACLRTLREVWGKPEHDGLVVDPTSPRSWVPVWVGGRTGRSLRRAVELGDGWMPFGLRGGEIAELLATVEVREGFDVVLGTHPLDPLADPGATRRVLDRLTEVGATRVTCVLRAGSAGHYVDQLSAMRRIGVDTGAMT